MINALTFRWGYLFGGFVVAAILMELFGGSLPDWIWGVLYVAMGFAVASGLSLSGIRHF